jgi:uncharacterized protein (TIGR03435 family)
MKRNTFEKRGALVLAALLAVPAAFGQAPAAPAADAKPAAAAAVAPKRPAGGWAFEVATIKPANMPSQADIMNGKMHVGMKTGAARVDIGFMSLTEIICAAYKIKQYQISGPDWMNAFMGGQRFDVLAKMPEGATKEQVPEMLQALLAERFRLAIHHDSKERSVYALVVGKGGVKMKEVAADPPPPAAVEKADAAPGEEPAPAADTGPQVKVKSNADGSGTATVHSPEGNAKISYSASGMHMEMEKMTMDKLAETLTPFVDRPVVDKTELKGNFQVALDLTMDDLKNMARKLGAPMAGAGAPGGEAGALPSDAASEPTGSIFKSVQQLGLKLESRKAPLDLIVIDHLEKMPTEN